MTSSTTPLLVPNASHGLLVSILLPVYRAVPDLLRQAIHSVVSQTISEWELIVVEDPSDRSASDVAADFNDPRIRHLVNSERTSFAEQLNRGLAEARADWIARMDADDICEPHRLETQLAFLAANQAVDVLGCQLSVMDGDGRHLGFREYPEDHEAIVAALRSYCPLAHPAVIFRRQVVLDAGGYETGVEATVADYDLWCRLAKSGVRFAACPEPLLKYRIHSAGMKSAKLRRMLRGTLEVKRRHWQNDHNFTSRLRMSIERLLLLLPPQLVLRLFRATHVRRLLSRSTDAS